MEVDIDHRLRPDARLSKGPHDLEVLWEEYDKGLDGNLAAKSFGYSEHGRVSSLYGYETKCGN